MPDITIDGSSISGITIDGTSVSEVTIDGNVAWTASTASLVYHYDANTFSASDGDTVGNWPDEQGNRNLSAEGSPTYKASGINSNPGIYYSGSSSNEHSNTGGGSISQPVTVFFVYKITDSTSNHWFNKEAVDAGEISQFALRNHSSDMTVDMRGGNNIRGSSWSSGTPLLITGIYDGSNSELRKNGSSVKTGDVGTNAIEGVEIGNKEVVVGEVKIYDGHMSGSELTNEEDNLMTKWGI